MWLAGSIVVFSSNYIQLLFCLCIDQYFWNLTDDELIWAWVVVASDDFFFICSFGAGYHTLYQWYKTVETEHFPDPTGLRARIEQWTFGLYPACIKYLMSAFDIPEVSNL